MAFIVADRVNETSTTTGTGTLTLAGAVTGFQTFDSVLATNDTTYYAITLESAGEWEVGLGTFTAPDQLARTTVLESSNSGSAVNFSAGAKSVFVTLPASKAVLSGAAALSLESTDAGAAAGPIITLYRNSASPAASDILGQVLFTGEDSAGNTQTYASVQATITDATSTSEDGSLVFSVVTAGTLTDELVLTGAALAPATSGGVGLGTTAAPFGSIVLKDNSAALQWGSNAFLYGNGTEISVNSATLLLDDGATARAPLKFQSGTNLTTAEAGAMEFDGTCLYGTVDAGNRGVIPCINYQYKSSTTSLTSQTAAQPFFDTGAENITLETGLYEFRLVVAFSAMSATSGNATINILGGGSATVSNSIAHTTAIDGAGNANGAWSSALYRNTTLSYGGPIATAGTNTNLQVVIQGVARINGAGTIIPSVALTTAAAATVEQAYFRIHRIGADTATTLGQWA